MGARTGRYGALSDPGTGRDLDRAGLGRYRRPEVAVAAGRGDPLVDVPPSALVAAEAERLGQARLDAQELKIEADIGCGRHAQVIAELSGLIAAHPLREGLWGLLMRALDRAGRHAEALAAYARAREVIAEELGVDPGEQLQRL